jgi:osmotically inducible lipoprotein OsmB
MKKILTVVAMTAGLGACNSYSAGDRAVGGALIGAGTGAVVGGLATGRAGGALAGAAIGGAGGAIVGAATTPRPPVRGRGWCTAYDEFGQRIRVAC